MEDKIMHEKKHSNPTGQNMVKYPPGLNAYWGGLGLGGTRYRPDKLGN